MDQGGSPRHLHSADQRDFDRSSEGPDQAQLGEVVLDLALAEVAFGPASEVVVEEWRFLDTFCDISCILR